MDGDWMIGGSPERVEDAALLTGRGRFIDDLPVPPGALVATILRSPYPHAEILGIDATAALALPGVAAVVTGVDVKALMRPFIVGVRSPIEHYPIAIDRARYVGEPVAVILARDRYIAEDAAELVEVDYAPLDVAVDPEEAMADDAAVLHAGHGSNLASERTFSYGDPDGAFAAADWVFTIKTHYPRSLATPIECFGLIAEYLPGEDTYEVTTHFQGPFALQPVMAMALGVPSNRLRIRTPPDSGGSFGVKQGVAPYAVLMLLAARIARRPVKWIEDRMEHLTAAGSATNRVVRLEAAVQANGQVTALRWDQIEDVGAYLKAPEPATLYRMHAVMTGAYAIPHLAIRNRVVVTNKTPTGLNRGFGGPQVYYPLEQLMQRIAGDLGLDPLEVMRRNLVPTEAMPFTTPSGGQLDSGDYYAVVEQAVTEGRLADLKAHRDAMRAEGKLYGIGYAAVIEPTISNMGYITTVLTPEERAKAGPKGGAQSLATVSADALGGVTIAIASTPQGQGHRTVAAQVAADVLGIRPSVIRVSTDLDTGRDPWSIASGNYSCRFAGATASAVAKAASGLRSRLARIAATKLNCDPNDVQFADGRVFEAGAPDAGLDFKRLAGESHWASTTLPQGVEPALSVTASWSPDVLQPPDDSDRINGSAAYGFIFDFCGVEVDRATGQVQIDRYVSGHDAGRILHQGMAEGQTQGGFAHGLGAALMEELMYDETGAFLSASLADYPLPTACEVPDVQMVHGEGVSPVTLTGAKGIGEGTTMSAPVCIANAVCDALDLAGIDLPLRPGKLSALIAERDL
ncbi:MAG: xanthine dehydrogenase family protein molybdopterin-binding subunit [Alphaproteobacteria bacterium]